MNIQLSDHFTYSRLLRFPLPPIVMRIFTSIYGVVAELGSLTLTVFFLVKYRKGYHYA